jgi:mannose-1-phosphate guanylyltransferase
MAGGSGTRFWPDSRQSRPKQLLTMAGDRSLIQATFDRCRPMVTPERTWVVTNARQAEATRSQLPEVAAAHVLCEPCGRNTAPCVGLAALCVRQQDPDAVMIVTPADHVIQNAAAFGQAVDRAVALIDAEPSRLVLFGVRPSYPATGFGYIEQGELLTGGGDGRRVASFREKPDRDTAEQYVASGRFFWNCGIFVWRADTILNALARFEPQMHARLMSLAEHVGRPGWDDALARAFPQLKSISIDYAVLEKADQLCLLEAPFDWDDVGSWQALARLHGHDSQGNTVVGAHCGVNTTGCIVRSSGEHLIATIGLHDFIVVHTPDATLVAPRNDEESVRQLVDLVRQSGYERYL